MSADLLGIGTSGLRAARAALEVAGDNVANASTPGYARRALNQVTGQAGATMTPLGRSLSAGVGVDVTGLRRISDPFRNNEARTTSGESSRFAALQEWLVPLQTAFPIGEASIGAGIGALFNAGSAVATNPAALAPRTAFLAAADSLAGRFRLSANKLADHHRDIGTALSVATSRISSLASTIASTNGEARRAGAGTVEAATIADRRDTLLEELHSLVAVRSTISLDGSLEIRFANGTLLVSGNEAGTLVARDAPGGFQIITDPYGSGAVSLTIDGGRVAGLLDASQRGITAAQNLDQLSDEVKRALNSAHQAGTDLDANPGKPLLEGISGATLSAPLTDPREVAAAAPPGADGNHAMLALIALREAGHSESYDAQAITIATALAVAREDGAAALSANEAATAARDAVSGVNLDEEASDILRFQQAYQAAARILTTARTLFDTLFDIR